jgi:hypothetical protein
MHHAVVADTKQRQLIIFTATEKKFISQLKRLFWSLKLSCHEISGVEKRKKKEGYKIIWLIHKYKAFAVCYVDKALVFLI